MSDDNVPGLCPSVFIQGQYDHACDLNLGHDGDSHLCFCGEEWSDGEAEQP